MQRALRLAVLALLAAPAPADTIVLAPSKDNTLYEESPSLSNGAGERIFAGVTASGVRRRALVAFDVAGAIPPGSTISGAQLVLELTQTIVGPQPVALHRVTADWGEGTSDAPLEEGGGAPATAGDATWVFRLFNTASWATPGGDFDPSASATILVNSFGSWTWGSTPAMTADVQLWLDQPAANFGWCLVGNETTITTAKRFNSRENPNVATRPRLVVDYCPPSAPYCIATPNSAGQGARIGSTGSTSVSANSFVLTVIGARPLAQGLFYFGPGQAQAPFGNGFQCVSGTIARLNGPTPTDGNGAFALPIDFTQPPASGIVAGSTWNFQFLYRDLFAGGAFFNTSNGLTASFCP